MASKLDAPLCCPPGSEPSLVTNYSPKGSELHIGTSDLNAYVVGSADAGAAIIVVYDIFGFNSGRTKEICDQLADEGYLVILPDFFRGVERSENDLPTGLCLLCKLFTFIPWIRSHSWARGLETDVQTTISWLQSKHKVTSVGMLGFCWGSYAVHHASASGNIACGASCHPSTEMIAKLNGEKMSTIMGDVACPQMCLPAGNDKAAFKEGQEAQQILASKSFSDQCIFQSFPKSKHGWVPRGNIEVPEVKADVDAAMKLLRDFFGRHLLKKGQ
jgi:dienelactone hydrolase